MSFYRRKLRHWQPEGRAIFLTWRLQGSLPRSKIPSSLTEGERFVQQDRELDAASFGPTHLRNPRIAEGIARTLCRAANQWELYQLHAWVVMSNHVHILVQPHKPLSEITRAVKNTTAREANLILGRTGRPFWQAESFDHWVRNSTQFNRIVVYIEQNPVKAGLVERPDMWKWSSAWAGQRPAPLASRTGP